MTNMIEGAFAVSIGKEALEQKIENLEIQLECATVEFAVHLRENSQLKAGIVYFREKVASLDNKNREQELKIEDLEVEIFRLQRERSDWQRWRAQAGQDF